MEFQTEAQRACYERIVPWMAELFGSFATPLDEAPGFAVIIGSALAHVLVLPWGDDDAIILTRSFVVTGVEIRPDLMHFLLRENCDMRFGAFGLDEDDDVEFEHSIVGSTCDKAELEASVKAVVLNADAYDDKIVARWGGRRAQDR